MISCDHVYTWYSRKYADAMHSSGTIRESLVEPHRSARLKHPGCRKVWILPRCVAYRSLARTFRRIASSSRSASANAWTSLVYNLTWGLTWLISTRIRMTTPPPWNSFFLFVCLLAFVSRVSTVANIEALCSVPPTVSPVHLFPLPHVGIEHFQSAFSAQFYILPYCDLALGRIARWVFCWDDRCRRARWLMNTVFSLLPSLVMRAAITSRQ